MTHITVTEQPILYTVVGQLSGEDVLISGVTPVGNLTGCAGGLTMLHASDENAYLGEIAAIADKFPLLPDSGWLEAGTVYQYGGGAVMVRQSHWRTHYDPGDTPSLFIVHREDATGVLEWVVGESVGVGTRRVYDGVTYECLQSHVTQSDWTPPAVPALWRAVVAPSAEWTAGVVYAVGDEVTYQGVLYRCRQAHTSLPGWEPPNVLALWLPIVE